MRFVAYITVEIVGGPEGSAPRESYVRLFCRERLPRTDNIAEPVSLQLLDEGVHVIWHDDPGMKPVSFAIEMVERSTGYLGDCGAREPTLPPTFVEVIFGKLSQCADVLRFPAKRAIDLARQGVGETEGHELSRFRRIEMRQVAASVPSFVHRARHVGLKAGGTPALH